MSTIIRYFLLSLVLTMPMSVWAANPQPTPIGTWLLTTKTKVVISMSNTPQKVSDVTSGYEYASFNSNFVYISTDWINKLRTSVQGDPSSVSQLVSGQWSLKNTTYTVNYDPFALNFKSASGLKVNDAFISRSDYIDLLTQMLGYTPAISSIGIIFYVDNGKLLSKGNSLKGTKQTILVASWTKPNSNPSETLLAKIDVITTYTGKRVTNTSTCCVSGSDPVQNAVESERFLTANAAQPEVETTQSGLQYVILQNGQGNAHPLPTDKVVVNYRGSFPSGNVFDYNSLTTFSVNQVISGFSEGLQLMTPGSKYRFYIPSSLAYGAAGNASIPGNAALIFDVELVQIKPQ